MSLSPQATDAGNEEGVPDAVDQEEESAADDKDTEMGCKNFCTTVLLLSIDSSCFA